MKKKSLRFGQGLRVGRALLKALTFCVSLADGREGDELPRGKR